MPIGSAKIGVLGAGLVPGGTQTFNASGTFTVPPGVKKVNITGKGGTGNPGNAGNPGNPGNHGTGGGGGGAGGVNYPYGIFCGSWDGGLAYKSLSPNATAGNFSAPNFTTAPFANNCTSSNCFAYGGRSRGFPPSNVPAVGYNGQSGASGNAGSAGNAGNPGTAGNASSGLCKTFPGGAAGNAGAAGAAGNGGSGGGGGGGGNPGPGNGGSGGNGGGNGGNGGAYPAGVPCPIAGVWGSLGGGGAGSVNSGQSGSPTVVVPKCNLPADPVSRIVIGGQGNVTAPLPAQSWVNQNPGSTTSMMGGGTWRIGPGNFQAGATAISLLLGNTPLCSPLTNRTCQGNLSPIPLRPDALRAGGGGGSNSKFCRTQAVFFGGGGGGGGRGLAGNAGGNSTGGAGSAGTPQTFNCVPVTPGSPYPITVASPGGQVVISWNPQ